MGDLGLQGAYGNDALFNLLHQRRMEQAASQMYADKMRQQQVDNSLRERQFQSTEELKRAQLADTSANRQAQEQDQRLRIGGAMADQIPAGFLPANNQAVGFLRSVGAGQDVPEVPAQGANFQGPAALGPEPGAVTNQDEQQGRAGGFLKTASAKQINDAATRQDKQADNARQAARDADLQRHERVMENKPAATALMTVQTVDENGQPVTKIVPKTAGASYAKGPSATTQNRLDSAQAVTQTGNDIIAQLADPKFKAVVGPELGRYSTLRDFIGNPPPEYAKLAGQIESYSLANMGVHGMRSAQGAEMIKHLLDQKHTPESLVASIQGLNGFAEHFLQNSGRSKQTDGGNGGGVMYARDPQGQLHTAKAGTALPAGWKEEKR